MNEIGFGMVAIHSVAVEGETGFEQTDCWKAQGETDFGLPMELIHREEVEYGIDLKRESDAFDYVAR